MPQLLRKARYWTPLLRPVRRVEKKPDAALPTQEPVAPAEVVIPQKVASFLVQTWKNVEAKATDRTRTFFGSLHAMSAMRCCNVVVLSTISSISTLWHTIPVRLSSRTSVIRSTK